MKRKVSLGVSIFLAAISFGKVVASEVVIDLGAVMVTDSDNGRCLLQWSGKRGYAYQIESSNDLESWDDYSGPYYSFGQTHSVSVATFELPNPNVGAYPPLGGAPAVFRSGHFMLDAYADGSTLVSLYGSEGAVTVRSSLDFFTGTAGQSFFFQNYQELEDDPENPGNTVTVTSSISLFLIRHSGTAPQGNGILSPVDLSTEQSEKLAFLTQLYPLVYADLTANNPVPDQPHQHSQGTATGERAFFRIVELLLDTDRDGIPDAVELSRPSPTSPYMWDSDGDGVSDGDEDEAGTDANDPLSAPVLTPPVWRTSFSSIEYSEAYIYHEGAYPYGGLFDFQQEGLLWSETFPYTFSAPQIDEKLPEFASSLDAPGTVEQANPISIAHAGGALTEQYEETMLSGGIFAYRQWLKVDIARDHEIRRPFLKLTEVRNYGLAGEHTVSYDAEIVEMVIPAKGHESNPVDLRPHFIEPVFDDVYTFIWFVPLEKAPEVLAVNSDFDEGRIDSTTGYAIPDCDDMAGVDQKTGAGNTSMALEAHRAHLDGTYAQYERVTDDMHAGWFGVHPDELLPEIWDDAIVTVRKVDKIDADTGYPESGQVRFYRKWGTAESQYRGIETYDFANLNQAPKDLVTGGINNAPLESVYGSTENINGGQFYMEGVRPGKITLEWRLQIGEADVKYEQTFLVATEKTKDEWIEDVYYQIKLQSDEIKNSPWVGPATAVYPIDLHDFDPNNGFFKNTSNYNFAYIQRVYYYYQQLYTQYPEQFYWAGMAKAAGAAVYAGMGDTHIWWHTTSDAVAKANLDKVLDDFLVAGNKKIFEDMAWAHHAYASSGNRALKFVKENQPEGSDPVTDFDAWDRIDTGINSENSASLEQGNQDLLFREQSIVMQPLYNEFKKVWVKPHSMQWFQEMFAGFVPPPLSAIGEIHMDEAFSLNSKNPIDIDSGPTLRDVVPGGSLSDFDHRWSWIENSSNGMLGIWMGTATGTPSFNEAQREIASNKALTSTALKYSMTGDLPADPGK